MSAKPQKNKARVLTLWLYEPHEMAELKEGRHTLHLGNYWDFHAGCSGSVMIFADGTRIDFKKEWNETIRRPLPVANMVAAKIGATVVIKHRKTPFNC
jgi:hypothetical protein